MKEIQREIGKRFRARRDEAHRTQEEVAHACGVATSTIQRLETGSLNPTLETLCRAADAIGVPVSSLFSEPLARELSPLEALEIVRIALQRREFEAHTKRTPPDHN